MSRTRRWWAVALTASTMGAVLALGGSPRCWAGDDDASQAGQEMKQENPTNGDTSDTATQNGGEEEQAPGNEKDQ